MRVNFDNARKSLVYHFNLLTHTKLTDEQREIMKNTRLDVIGFVCMYDPDGDDCHDLSNDVVVEEVRA